jgi:hypothetical protein
VFNLMAKHVNFHPGKDCCRPSDQVCAQLCTRKAVIFKSLISLMYIYLNGGDLLSREVVKGHI